MKSKITAPEELATILADTLREEGYSPIINLKASLLYAKKLADTMGLKYISRELSTLSSLPQKAPKPITPNPRIVRQCPSCDVRDVYLWNMDAQLRGYSMCRECLWDSSKV